MAINNTPTWYRTITWLAAIVSIIATVLPPVIYLGLSFNHEQASLQTEVEISAQQLSQLVSRNPELWRFEEARLEELLAHRPIHDNRKESRQIFSLDEQLIAEVKDKLHSPLISDSGALLDSGHVVGTITITRSMRHFIHTGLLVSIASLLFGAFVYITMRALPIRILRETFDTLHEEKELANVTLQSIGDAVIVTDEKTRIKYLNPIAEYMTGWNTIDAIGLPMSSVFNIVMDETRHLANNPIEDCIRDNRIVEMDEHTVLIRKIDGKEFQIEDSAAPIRNNDGSVMGAVMVFHDVTERIEAKKRLSYQANHDELTGLPNRSNLRTRLAQAVSFATRHQTLFAVLFLDLDRFKAINDSLGHDVGDDLLIAVVERLRKILRLEDTLARLGGDEFNIILENLNKPEDAGVVAQKIVDAIVQPFFVRDYKLFVSVSVGISIFPHDAGTAELLIKNADTAMYLAKDHGRNNYQYFTATMNQEATERLHIENALRHALENNEFFLEYQPKLDLNNNKIVGMEALIRWQNDKYGRVMPLKFIPLLEETGLILPVGHWVIKTAVQQAKQWLDAGWPMRMSVNLSVRQFRQKDLLENIEKILQKHALPAKYLEVEITESLLMDNKDSSMALLNDLKKLGIAIALDDFGTGYSSLSYLRFFPFDIVKIDKTFVNDVNTDASAQAIVKAIVEMAHALNMEVIAEGVETADQLDSLKAMGCNEIQGYWLSKPQPAEAISRWLQARH
jgi:diguanylate cyclase (GGDEF)-like protein/PAS domain S-box-containing protein